LKRLTQPFFLKKKKSVLFFFKQVLLADGNKKNIFGLDNLRPWTIWYPRKHLLANAAACSVLYYLQKLCLFHPRVETVTHSRLYHL